MVTPDKMPGIAMIEPCEEGAPLGSGAAPTASTGVKLLWRAAAIGSIVVIMVDAPGATRSAGKSGCDCHRVATTLGAAPTIVAMGSPSVVLGPAVAVDSIRVTGSEIHSRLITAVGTADGSDTAAAAVPEAPEATAVETEPEAKTGRCTTVEPDDGFVACDTAYAAQGVERPLAQRLGWRWSCGATAAAEMLAPGGRTPRGLRPRREDEPEVAGSFSITTWGPAVV
mmetsp:Transcript_93344/g.237595  ORF Transcript_93344/g.237595 Transcript_93344/m.237595 type:complete len:226 (+) Transcript_93344:174-851(+)